MKKFFTMALVALTISLSACTGRVSNDETVADSVDSTEVVADSVMSVDSVAVDTVVVEVAE